MTKPTLWRSPWLWLGPLLLLGFWLRLSYLLGAVYFFDEFISMLAAQMVAQRGLPILPSGLFYDHGLLLSFLSGGLIALLGFKEEIARWPVLLLSVITIAAYYLMAQRLFGSRLAGVLAATLAAFDEWSIIWGARARMYAPAHLFVLLSMAWLFIGTLQHPERRARYLGLVFLAAALFSHTLTFLIVPPLAVLLLLFTLTYRRDLLGQPRLWQDIFGAALVMGLVFAIVAVGQTGSINAIQDPLVAQAPPPFGLEFLRGFFLPGLDWSRFDNLVGFFEAKGYEWLQPIIILSLIVSLYRLLRGQAKNADMALLFLAFFLGLVIFEMGALLTDSWSKSRYVFILTLPVFLLVSAGGIAQLFNIIIEVTAKLSRGRPFQFWAQTVATGLGVALIMAQLGQAAWNTAHIQGTGDYNTAFAYVREQWQPGDRVMTIHPSAAWLYLARSDYYANQATAAVLSGESEQDENSLVDRFTGGPLIDSVEELNATLARGERLWFVVDHVRLFERFEPLFTQEILAQMDLVHQTGATEVFLSRPYPSPVPAEPMAVLDANFGDVVQLGGYSLDLTAIAPDDTVSLGLFWRLTGTPSRSFKVFVQLRNAQGQIISQSDHF
jgi:hypothetical protein